MKGIVTGGGKRRGAWGMEGLDQDEILEIHLATLDVLQNCGVTIGNDEALEIFDGGGAWVDRATRRVRIPSHLVEDGIASAPSSILMAARDPSNDYVLQPGRTGFTNFGVGVRIVDADTDELRDSTLEDVAHAALLCDALDSVDVVSPAVDPTDVPEDETKALIMAETVLQNCSKHVVHGEVTTAWQVRKLAEIGAVLAGGQDRLRQRPMFTTGSCPTSPLHLGDACCSLAMECARVGFPNLSLSMCMTGATSPVSLAGTLVVHNAEQLACLVLTQLTDRGSPFIAGASVCSMEMTAGTANVGSPEASILNEAAAELARYYLLPCWTAGG